MKQANVYVIGVFDLFHTGHLEILRRSKALGNRLIVAINSDDLVSNYKRKPFFTEEERLKIVQACRYVDEAFIIHKYDNRKYIQKYNIDIIVHGDDWDLQDYMKQINVTEDFLKKTGVKLVLLPYTKGISTSQIIQKIKEV